MSRLIITFTDEGEKLSARLMEVMPEFAGAFGYSGHKEKARGRHGLHKLIRKNFETGECIVFISAMGIAVRKIAPFIKDKMTDPPVIVMDQAGQFVIPLLSGHTGGANEISQRIAEAIGAVPVITTASDVSGTFAVDEYARKNGYHTPDRDQALAMSAGAVAGKKVEIKEDLFGQTVHIKSEDIQMCLYKRPYVLGVGCKKGTSFANIEVYINSILDKYNININDIGLVASIDLKKDEPGLIEWCDAHRKKLVTFSAEELMAQDGDFTPSKFVMETTGADNVCERAIVAAGGRVTIRKLSKYGVTVALGRIR